MPNPESALNEEAGRLLLEDYDTYASHARLMTDIHAAKNNLPIAKDMLSDLENNHDGVLESIGNTSPQKRPFGAKPSAAKDKKKSLRRL